jgi:nucleotide-binding universal stress UspA family protein
MPFRTITTVVTAAAQGALQSARQLALAEDAHLDVVAVGFDRTIPQVYAGIGLVIADDARQQAQADATAAAAAATRALGDAPPPAAVQALTVMSDSLSPVVARAIRHADIAVLPAPGAAADPTDTALIEAALFAADLPVLLVPPAGLPAALDRVIVAWNDSPEAMRALRSALPMLAGSAAVEVVLVDPPPHDRQMADPGTEVTRLLSRHGVSATVTILPRTLPRVADVLMRHASDTGAGLIVMGAYGHSRLREAILGGATRDMINGAGLPVLLKH